MALRTFTTIYSNRVNTNHLLALFALNLTIMSILLANNSDVMPGLGQKVLLPFKQILLPDLFQIPKAEFALNENRRTEDEHFYMFFVDESNSTDDVELTAALMINQSMTKDAAQKLLKTTKEVIISSLQDLAIPSLNTSMQNYQLKHLLVMHQLWSLLKKQEEHQLNIKFNVFGFSDTNGPATSPWEAGWLDLTKEKVLAISAHLTAETINYTSTDLKVFIQGLNLLLSNIEKKSSPPQKVVTVISDFLDTQNHYLASLDPLFDRLSLYCSGSNPMGLNLLVLPSKRPKVSMDILEGFQRYIPAEFLKKQVFPFSVEPQQTHLILKSGLSPAKPQNDFNIKFYYEGDQLIKSSSSIWVKNGLDREDPRILTSVHSMSRETGILGKLNYSVINSDHSRSTIITDKGFIHNSYYKSIPLKDYEGLILTYHNYNGNKLPNLAIEIFIENHFYRYIIPLVFERRLLQDQAWLIVFFEFMALISFILLSVRVVIRVRGEWFTIQSGSQQPALPSTSSQ